MCGFCSLPGVIKSSSRAFLPCKPPAWGWTSACSDLPFFLQSSLPGFWSTSPLMEEPQLLLHCQRGRVLCSALEAHLMSGYQPSPCRLASSGPAEPAHPFPSAKLLLPSSISTIHSPLKSCLLILAHSSKWLHSNSILCTDTTGATSSPGKQPVLLGSMKLGLGIPLHAPCPLSPF